MKAFLMVEAGLVVGDSDLEFWIDRCMDFNPRAKSSKNDFKIKITSWGALQCAPTCF
ncbi:MAG: hypothetical protein IPJ54_20980 [Saprospiraceae bacterium]|nr:hypothetical protein [Saprospiraceae bacterium]